MLDRARLKDLMDGQSLGQSELARRVGVTQATIYKLLTGETQGTKHLHKIARALGTTSAYLTGETGDPDSDTPDREELASDERELVAAYRALSPKDRAAVLRITLSMNGIPPTSGVKASVHDRRTQFYAEGEKA